MANEENLIPNSERSPKEVRENGAKGGIISGEARRNKKIFKSLLLDLINEEVTVGDKKIPIALAILKKQIQSALKDSERAREWIVDRVDGKAEQEIEITNPTIADDDIMKKIKEELKSE